MTDRINPFKVWSKESLPPKEFVKKYSLPQVARIFDGGADDLKSLAQLDLRQPFLLSKSYSAIKVHARSLQIDCRGSYREVGPAVVIPEDYTGWFTIMSEDGRNQAAQHYSSIEQVANANIRFFLVRNDTPAYRLSDLRGNAGKFVYTKTTVKVGHVMKLLGVFEDITSRQNKLASKFFGANANSCKYAQCLNYKGEVLFLPFTARGMFYATATKATRCSNQVYLMSQILKFAKFPLTVRLVCGFLPKVPCNFTGVLRLTCARREDIILACTLLKERNVMLEMDMNSGFTLCKALEVDHFVHSDLHRSALAFCTDEAEIWRRQMKVMHYVYPETSKLRKSSRHLPPPTLITASKKEQELYSSSPFTTSTAQCAPPRAMDQVETQSVCISMIFDDLDEDESTLKSKKEEKVTKTLVKPAKKTKFWSLQRLKELVQSQNENYTVLRPKMTINDLVNDGSQNANDEFTVTAKLTKDVGKTYTKFPGFDIPEHGTYLLSRASIQPIYDSIS